MQSLLWTKFLILCAILPVSKSFSKSYIDYLYKKYEKEVKSIAPLLTQYCHKESCSYSAIIESELLFMFLRERKPSLILDIGNNVTLQTVVTLLAITENGYGNLTSIYSTAPLISSNQFEKKKLHIHHTTLHGDIYAHMNTIFNISFDMIIANEDDNYPFLNKIFLKFIQNQLSIRSLWKKSLNFYGNIWTKKYQLNNIYKSSIQLRYISKLLNWLNINGKSYEIYTFHEDHSISHNQILISLHNKYFHNYNNSNSFITNNSNTHLINYQSNKINSDLIYGFISISVTPKLTIITPCSHPENLLHIYKSIKFNHVYQWIIIHDLNLESYKQRLQMEQIMNRHKSRRRHRHPNDGKSISTLTDENYLKLNKTTVFHGKFPKIKELYCNDTGFFGNSQRNYALNNVYIPNSNLIYFLDDDNIFHRNFWILLHDTTPFNIYTFDRKEVYNQIHQGNRCQKWEIDTCQYLIGQPLIQDIRWELKKRDADGIFIQNICNITAGKFIYIHIVASYHNGLKRLLHKREFG